MQNGSVPQQNGATPDTGLPSFGKTGNGGSGKKRIVVLGSGGSSFRCRIDSCHLRCGPDHLLRHAMQLDLHTRSLSAAGMHAAAFTIGRQRYVELIAELTMWLWRRLGCHELCQGV